VAVHGRKRHHMTGYVERPLEGRSVAITGAGRGIGAATARLLAELGASVALAARSKSELVEVAESIRDAGGRATYLVTDVTKPGDLDELVQLAIEQFGSLDALINNAGIAYNSPLAAVDLADWNAMIDVNLRGVLHGIAAALPHFVNQRSGHIVTVASVAAYKWAPGQGVYAATKAAVRALGEVLRQEAAEFNVRSTLVSPGFTHTEFVSTSSRDTAQLASLQARRDALAMPPAAVAEAIAYALTQPDDIDVGEIIVRPTAHP
jgi:NADP-dependent 3-hydroxy acid dehydrogenase YdfG